MNCLFCSIAKHDLPAKIQFESDDFVAFDDIHPQAKTHILLITKKHLSSVAALDDSDLDLIAKMILTARDLAKEKGLDTSGYRLVFNSGIDAGQEVDHIHLHILGGNQLGHIA